MQNAPEQYAGVDFQPLDREEAETPERTSMARAAFFVLLAIVLGALAGIVVMRFAQGDSASAAGGLAGVASSTPAGVVQTSSPAIVVRNATAGGSGTHVVDNQAPATPKLLSPSDGAAVSENGAKVTLTWSKVTDPSGVRYRVQIQQWLGGGAGWGDIKLVKGLKSRHYGHTVGAMRERWRVIAVDLAGNKSAPSEWRTIQPVAPQGTLKIMAWSLDAISDGAGGMLDPLDGTSPTIAFFDNDTANGSDGLNDYSVPFTVSGSSMHFGAATHTMMAGSPDAMKEEQYFMNALKNTASYSIQGQFLTLRGPGGETLAVFHGTAPQN